MRPARKGVDLLAYNLYSSFVPWLKILSSTLCRDGPIGSSCVPKVLELRSAINPVEISSSGESEGREREDYTSSSRRLQTGMMVISQQWMCYQFFSQ